MCEEESYILDIQGLEDDASQTKDGSTRIRKWIGIHFECCGVYSRIYRNKEQTAYTGQCPRCARKTTVQVGPGGTDHRMFRAR